MADDITIPVDGDIHLVANYGAGVVSDVTLLRAQLLVRDGDTDYDTVGSAAANFKQIGADGLFGGRLATSGLDLDYTKHYVVKVYGTGDDAAIDVLASRVIVTPGVVSWPLMLYHLFRVLVRCDVWVSNNGADIKCYTPNTTTVEYWFKRTTSGLGKIRKLFSSLISLP